MSERPLDKYLAALTNQGAFWVKDVPAGWVVTAPWVRFKCQFGCDGYNQGLHCPPRTPTPGETAAVIACYHRAILAAWDTPPGTTERRATRRKMHEVMLELERELFLDGFYKAFAFVSGPCNLCEDCDVTRGCIRPGVPRPAMEACGMDVFATMANAGFNLSVRTCMEENYTSCGLILVE